MNFKKTLAILAGVLAVLTSEGSGFSLYQPSVVSHAMGGALMGKAMDASANFNNPATLTDLTNIWVTVGFVTEHPRGSVRGHTDGVPWGYDETMDSGLFWLPHLQLAVPLPADFVFGLGIGADYGLGTQYGDNWRMNWSTTETTVEGLVINPNLAYRITDKWSVGAGLRWLFFDFEQYSHPQATMQGAELGTFSNRLKGDNEWKSVGWQLGTKYDITKTFSAGIVYKSAIDVTVRGKTSNDVIAYNETGIGAIADMQVRQGLAEKGVLPSNPLYPIAYDAAYGSAVTAVRKGVDQAAAQRTGAAEADLTLPQSITAGCNWDVVPTWHLGFAVSWTQWSQFDSLHFSLAPDGPDGDKDILLNWRDTWRGSVGSCWDFAEDWKWMVSYVYDMDCTDPTQSSAMLPPADRHIAATGFVWNIWRNLDLALSYSCIFMDGRSMDTTDSIGRHYHLETCRGFCHAGGFSVTYRF